MKRSHRLMLLSSLGLLLLASSLVVADVTLPAIISDNMVLQTGRNLPIWGTAEPDEEVTVSIAGQRLTTQADDQGRWMVKLAPFQQPIDQPVSMTVTGKNTLTIKNILVGEVWVCSGQSNMRWMVSKSADAEKEMAAADYPSIRLFTLQNASTSKPCDGTPGQWRVCKPGTVGYFSAVAYYFGRHLNSTLNVPVGLVLAAVGGTPAEAWTSETALESHKGLKSILDRWKQAEADYNRDASIENEYQNKLAKWKRRVAKAKAKGRRLPPKPAKPHGRPGDLQMPCGLYNGMIAPLIPYAIKGAIWYQGESNATRAYQYRQLFPAMICHWRQAWAQGDFPFLFVQLTNFQKPCDEPTESIWAELREAQLMTLRLPKTGMAITIDIGDADDIHPKNKQDVGRRLALAAEAIAYHRNVVYSGPIYDSMTVEGNQIRLRFTHLGSGLKAKHSETFLIGFTVAGADRQFVHADAHIDGNTVVVKSDRVSNPVAVRYAWADNPACNLYNKEGLPASPFRTDDWPGITMSQE